LSLSSGARALADAAAQRLPADVGQHVSELLTAHDRLMLSWISDLAQNHGFDQEDLSKLLVDLIAYRDQQLAPGELGSLSSALSRAAEHGARALSSVALAQAPGTEAPLSLLRFSARDEALARTILSSFALRDTLVDHGFVRALLDPDRHGTHAVDFAFLRRVVLALSPAHADGAVDPGMSFARRDAREQLSTALSSLGLPAAQLTPYLAEAAEHGAGLLHERVSTVLFSGESARSAHAVLATLTRNDRALLGLLYVAARARGVPVGLVDEVARALVVLREATRAPAARAPSVASEEHGRTVLSPAGSEASPRASSAPSDQTRTRESSAPSAQAGPRAGSAASAQTGPRASRAPSSEAGLRASSPASASVAPPASRVPSAQVGPQISSPLGASTADEGSANELWRGVAQHDDALSQPAPLRSFASAAQIAARLVGSYRSLAPVGGPSMSAQVLVRPLNLAEALGLSGLISELNVRAQRKRRWRRQRWRGAATTLRARRRGPASPLQRDRPL
jgi:hypothetical protein